MTIFISDTSNHDYDRGSIDWNRVRGAGIEIALAKATEGDPGGYHYIDPYFPTSLGHGRAAGMRLMGGYHCLAHGDIDSITRQVNMFLSYIEQNGGVDKGFWMIDVEPFAELKSRGMAPKLADVLNFESVWHTKTGGMPLMHYIPKWYWEEWGSPSIAGVRGPLVASNYPISASQPFATLYSRDGGDHGPGWAAYGGKAPAVWQFASSNQVPGISGNSDCNAFKGTVEDFVRLVSKPTTTPVSTYPKWPGRVLYWTSPLMHGSDVKMWQQKMHDRGWSIGVDGVFGSQSDDICRQFQAEKRLAVDGKVGQKTWDATFTAPVTK